MCADITSYSAQGRRVADLLSNLFKTFMIQSSVALTSNNLRISKKFQSFKSFNLFLSNKKERNTTCGRNLYNIWKYAENIYEKSKQHLKPSRFLREREGKHIIKIGIQMSNWICGMMSEQRGKNHNGLCTYGETGKSEKLSCFFC